MVSKICCISRLNSWLNIFDTVMKRHAATRIKVNSYKWIWPDFIRNVLDGCRDYHDDLPLVYQEVNLPLWQIQDLPCLILVMLLLEFNIGLIESACPSLLLSKPDPILRFFSRPSVTLTWNLNPPYVRKAHVTNHLQRIWKNIGVELDK